MLYIFVNKLKYFVQYMSMLIALIVTELVTAAAGGLVTYRVLSGLEERLNERLASHYGDDPTSDVDFSRSLDFAQYKVKASNYISRCH